jgi:hypothetical protein
MAIKSSDQISIVDLTDGYSVILTSDGYTFPGTTSAAKAGSCTTQVIAMRGAEQVAASVNLNNVTKPTGITVTKDQDATSPTLTISASTSFTAAGFVDIPVVVGDVTIHKKFAVSIAFTGAQGIQGETGQTGATGAAGKGVASVAITYQAGSSNTTAPTGTWQNSPPSVSQGQYLWTKIVFTYTDSTTSDPMYSVARQGSNGSNGTSSQWYTGTGITGTSSTATIFSGSGVTDAKVGDMYLNTSTYNTYRCTVAGAASAAKWVYVNNIKGQKGDTGNAGADAITMSVTSSNGTIFKNSSIETVLTAHVYKAGAEVTGSALTALGTIKWYKDGGGTAVATGQTLTISAGDVTNKATYVAQLEA